MKRYILPVLATLTVGACEAPREEAKPGYKTPEVKLASDVMTPEMLAPMATGRMMANAGHSYSAGAGLQLSYKIGGFSASASDSPPVPEYILPTTGYHISDNFEHPLFHTS